MVLHPRRITGYAPTPEKYIPSGMPRGQQLYYLIFPPSDLKGRWVDITNQVAKLAAREGGLVEVAVMEPLYEYNAEIYYYLDSTMTCVRVRASDHFTAIHNRYEQQGRFSSSLNDDYFDQLRKDILYWNGRQLVNGRTESVVAERSVAK